MGNLGDSLEKHAKRLGISKQVEAVGVVEIATKEIARFMPDDVFEVISFNAGNLKIGADSSSVKNEISLNLSPVFKKRYSIKRLVFSSMPERHDFS